MKLFLKVNKSQIKYIYFITLTIVFTDIPNIKFKPNINIKLCLPFLRIYNVINVLIIKVSVLYVYSKISKTVVKICTLCIFFLLTLPHR